MPPTGAENLFDSKHISQNQYRAVFQTNYNAESGRIEDTH